MLLCGFPTQRIQFYEYIFRKLISQTDHRRDLLLPILFQGTRSHHLSLHITGSRTHEVPASDYRRKIGSHLSAAPFGAAHIHALQGPRAEVPVRYVILPWLQVGAWPSTTCGCAGAATGVALNC